jgi:hypothetical protein
MNGEEFLKNELEECFSDWEGDFDVDIEQESIDGNSRYYSVIITHKRLGQEFGYSFPSRVTFDKCEMEYCEDCWYEISKANVFSFMWFDEAETRQR